MSDDSDFNDALDNSIINDVVSQIVGDPFAGRRFFLELVKEGVEVDLIDDVAGRTLGLPED